MAFPTNTTLISDFEYTDGALDGTSGHGAGVWSTSTFDGSGTRIYTASGLLQCGNPPSTGSCGTDASYGAGSGSGYDVEFQLDVQTVSTAVATNIYILTNIQNYGQANASYYFVSVGWTGAAYNWYLKYGVANGSDTTLAGPVAQTVASGSQIGVAYVGGHLTGYYKAPAGSWAQVIDVAASDIQAAGPAAIISGDIGGRYDNFRGGYSAGGDKSITAAQAAATAAGIAPTTSGYLVPGRIDVTVTM